ncbi:MAG TPA: glycosyl hydrolase family 39 [Acidobacteriaceae bacterium]
MHRLLSAAFLVLLALLRPLAAPAQAAAPETVTIDTRDPGTPLPHFWEQMFGSGRAILTLRDDYRKDLRTVHAATGFQYVRFHAILHDEVGVYDEDRKGRPHYNFSYVDQIYDGLLADGVRPFVEISFMPAKLAARPDYHAFWYKQIVSPPADYAKWDALITAFTQHLVARYGIDEVAQWYFEVWNEPNIDFWTGRPAQQTYFELYDHTARAVKAVNARLRIGGPATAQAAWVDAMIAHAAAQHVPLDFVSTHVYGNDVSHDVFGDQRPIAPHQMVPAAVHKVHDQITASAMPQIPLIWSEFNATYANETQITDSTYEGPWMADTIRQCDGLVQSMSYWSFSDVFEEQGVVKTPFYGGYGLIAERDIPKPAFLAFSLLHTLGQTRLRAASQSVLATRRPDGTLVFAVWNLVEPGLSGPEKTIALDLQGVSPAAKATVRRVDATHGDTWTAWKAMGAPANPTLQQIATLKRVGTLAPPEPVALTGTRLTLRIPSSGLAVIEVHP